MVILGSIWPAPGQDLPASPASSPEAGYARYFPRDQLVFYAESEGLYAHRAEWTKTAAWKILTETTTGAMLEQVFAQLIDQNLAAGETEPEKAIRPGMDYVATFKLAMNQGFGFGVVLRPGDAERPMSWTLVLGGAMKPEVKATTASLIRALISAPDTKVETQTKGTYRVAQLERPGMKLSWFVEPASLDLVMTDDPEGVLAVLDGNTTSAGAHPVRERISKPEGSFVPVVRMFCDIGVLRGAVEPFGTMAASIQQAGVQGGEYRWGIDGVGLMDELRVIMPQPRQGWLGLIDQPTFTQGEVLAVPEGVEEFGQVALDFSKLGEALIAEAIKNDPSFETDIRDLERTVSQVARLKFREEVLPLLGPRAIAFPLPAPAKASRNLLSAVTDSLSKTGLQVPRTGVLVEVRDTKKASAALDAVMVWVNKEFKKLVDSSAGSANSSRAGGGVAGPVGEESGSTRTRVGDRSTAVSSGGSGSSKGQQFEFRPQPLEKGAKLFVLSMPTAYAALTNARPAIVMGKHHLILASDPGSARQLLELEAKQTPGNWKMPESIAAATSTLPKPMVMFAVQDPRDQLPQVLADFPNVLMKSVASLREPSGSPLGGIAGIASSGNGPAPGRASGGGGAPPAVGADDDDPGAGGGKRGSLKFGPGGIGGSGRLQGVSLGGADSSKPAATPPPAAGPGAAGPGAAEKGTPGTPAEIRLNVDPALLPRPEQIAAHLFPSATSVTVDELGIRLTTRQAFYGISPDSTGMEAQIQNVVTNLLGGLAGGSGQGGPGGAGAAGAANESGAVGQPGQPGQPGVPGILPSPGRGGRAGRGRFGAEEEGERPAAGAGQGGRGTTGKSQGGGGLGPTGPG